MSDDADIREDTVTRIYQQLRFTDHPADVFRRRMEQLESLLRWLGGYFRAVGVLLQVPGAAAYRYQEHASDDDLWPLVWNADPKSTINVLAAALDRLDSAPLLSQVPGGEAFKPRPLPVEARVRIAERDRAGLLAVVADCLDRLLVVPHIPGEAEMYGLVGGEGKRRSDEATKRRRGGDKGRTDRGTKGRRIKATERRSDAATKGEV
jgi:hypothetical protein